MKVRFTLHKM